LPRLTIIAGPNGAGKSTSSKSLLKEQGIEAFDFDKEFYNSWKVFGYDPAVERGVRESAEKKFIEARAAAIQERKSFAFETNYHVPEVIKNVSEFRQNNFETELIFIALLSPDQAIERVKTRVAQKGHSVDSETIIERFYSGLKILDETFDHYESFTLNLSLENDFLTLIHIEDLAKDIIKTNNAIPQSLRVHLPRLIDYVK
jgi:predicted ABC-type ATPase